MDLMKLAELITDEPQEAKQKKYRATAYVDRCMHCAIDGIDTDDYTDILDFVWDNCQKGLCCEIINHETGERKHAYPEYFNEDTIGVEDLIRDV